MRTTDSAPARSRFAYAALVAVTVALGLASRRYGDALPAWVAAYAGDALWAAMIVFVAAVLWPRTRTRVLAPAALVFCVAIELSQRYRAPWIDAVRGTRLGALVLGQGFLWSDLACYAGGVALAAAIDAGVRARGVGTRVP